MSYELRVINEATKKLSIHGTQNSLLATRVTGRNR